MEEHAFSFELEEALPVIYLNGNTSHPAPVPTLYAIRFLCRELELALNTLLHSQELQEILSEREGEKNEIYDRLQRIILRFKEFLMVDARR
ncbi:MAG: hypothetical protein ACFFF9_11390 [Candidatus Thorarchaeota archaeon]